MNLDDKFLEYRNSVFCDNNRFLLSSIGGSEQEKDLTLPANCNGYGRIRHFRRHIADNWLNDPLPIDPACISLNLTQADMIQTQVFQIAACNANCWYCFVPDNLKKAAPHTSRWFCTNEMLELLAAENFKPQIIDLSGGNPELVPEWIVQTMHSLELLGLDKSVYLWSDDTLTTDYTFRFLPKKELEYFSLYKNYGKVACFKGYDEDSFSFNTGLPEYLFNQQFSLFKRYLSLGIDIYGYITLTSSDSDKNRISLRISKLMDRLQEIHFLLPLRVVPLKISVFSPVRIKLTDIRKKALENQFIAID
ncbi:MAG: hypothetical protein LBR85_09910, partial [Oscillospiraceae bacterium]|nr:hypothetical protein [Oscillospiraceae bacterium]